MSNFFTNKQSNPSSTKPNQSIRPSRPVTIYRRGKPIPNQNDDDDDDDEEEEEEDERLDNDDNDKREEDIDEIDKESDDEDDEGEGRGERSKSSSSRVTSNNNNVRSQKQLSIVRLDHKNLNINKPETNHRIKRSESVSSSVSSSSKPKSNLKKEVKKRSSSSDSSGSSSEDSSSSEGEEEEDDDDEEDSSSSEEEQLKPIYKPVFTSKKDRQVKPSDNNEAKEPEGEGKGKVEEEKDLLDEEQQRRKKQSQKLVEITLQRELAEKEVEEVFPDVDDTDGLDPESEFEAWRLRELKRLTREREALIQREREKEELEARRSMPENQRLKEDLEYAKKTRESKSRSKQAFLQKYHHKGVFYGDSEILKKHDFSAPTEGTITKMELLPTVMQVKDFGKMSRTKWTHLAKEDTTSFDAGWSQKKPNFNQNGSSIKANSKVCFRCGDLNHIKKDCPKQRQEDGEDRHSSRNRNDDSKGGRMRDSYKGGGSRSYDRKDYDRPRGDENEGSDERRRRRRRSIDEDRYRNDDDGGEYGEDCHKRRRESREKVDYRDDRYSKEDDRDRRDRERRGDDRYDGRSSRGRRNEEDGHGRRRSERDDQSRRGNEKDGGDGGKESLKKKRSRADGSDDDRHRRDRSRDRDHEDRRSSSSFKKPHR